MKRILFAIMGTVVGIVALLDFKTGKPVAQAGGLPSLGASSSSVASTSTAAPRDPTAGTTKAAGKAKTRTTAPTKKAATPSPTATSTPAVRNASYTGAAVQTQYGIVQVKVSVQGAKITDVGFVQLTAFDQRSADINSQAAPILLRETMSAQSAHIDTVSGATYTSDGYLQSLQSALDKAGIK